MKRCQRRMLAGYVRDDKADHGSRLWPRIQPSASTIRLLQRITAAASRALGVAALSAFRRRWTRQPLNGVGSY
jgi:hypothetical protein